MHLDPLMPVLAGSALAVFLLGITLRKLHQPHVVAYLVAGILLGPHVLRVIPDQEIAARLGVIGVDFLLFFVGMEISPRRLLASWKVSVLGTGMQILVSVLLIWLIATWYGWPLERTILLGFVISLSSTAVVLNILEDRKEMGSRIGRAAVGVLLVQDMALIPMLMVIGLLGGSGWSAATLTTQVLGGGLILLLVVGMSLRREIHLPLGRWLMNDHEIQVFAALAICMGLAFLTGRTGLSTALGAFVGGMVVGFAQETGWVHRSLHSFRIVFVALFFVSVGMMVDLQFLAGKWHQILLLLGAVLLTKTAINAGILRVFGNNWKDSLYGGSLLAQIGEFSFVLAAIGHQAGIISSFAYQATVLVIALSLLVSPVWILLLTSMRVPRSLPR